MFTFQVGLYCAMKLIIYHVNHMNLQIAYADNVSQIENLKAINRRIILRDLCHYLIRNPCYPGENRAMPPRLRYFIYCLARYPILFQQWSFQPDIFNSVAQKHGNSAACAQCTSVFSHKRTRPLKLRELSV